MKNSKVMLTRTAKAALPFFVLFGGSGFASSRNPLSLKSSKKFIEKSVVYLQKNDTLQLATLELNGQKNIVKTSPFAAFTHKPTKRIASVKNQQNSRALNFLQSNNLFNSDKTVSSQVSGNLLHRKNFADLWNWTSQFTQGTDCVIGATYNGSLIAGFAAVNMAPSFYECQLYGDAATLVSGTMSSTLLAQCQAFHMACDQEPLPVELMNFEVD